MGHFCKFGPGFISDGSSASSYSNCRLKLPFWFVLLFIKDAVVCLCGCGMVLGLWAWAMALADHYQPGGGGLSSISGAVWWALEVSQLWEGKLVACQDTDHRVSSGLLNVKGFFFVQVWATGLAYSFFLSFFSFFPWKVLSLPEGFLALFFSSVLPYYIADQDWSLACLRPSVFVGCTLSECGGSTLYTVQSICTLLLTGVLATDFSLCCTIFLLYQRWEWCTIIAFCDDQTCFPLRVHTSHYFPSSRVFILLCSFSLHQATAWLLCSHSHYGSGCEWGEHF